MNEEQMTQLTAELRAFNQLQSTSDVQAITDAYNGVLATVQLIMLNNDNPDGHDRAWSLLKDDAYKELAAIQEGRSGALADLKLRISQVGHLLLGPMNWTSDEQ